MKEIRRGEVAQHPGHVFVPRGDPALTRALLARGALRVVSTLKGRQEQIGVAALPAAIEEAKREVEATAGERAAARERSRERRARDEAEYRAAFEAALARLFPAMPAADREQVVRHTTEVSSGRVGRSSWAKSLGDEPLRLAVRAHIRHAHTDYDARLRRAGLGRAFGRADRDARDAARRAVKPVIESIYRAWIAGSALPVAPLTPSPAPSPKEEAPPGQLRLWQRPLG